MGASQRNKGARGEREVIELLQPVVRECYLERGYPEDLIPKLKRNTMQSDGGGFDIHGLSWCALEVKRCETLCLPAWWRQAVRQAGPNETPVLIYRKSKNPWRVRMRAVGEYRDRHGTLRGWTYEQNVAKNAELTEISADVFLVYVRRRLLDLLAPFEAKD